ncbi:MAG: hypothetical protein WA323_20965 [Candidatus Nitrosopolaris sp.]
MEFSKQERETARYGSSLPLVMAKEDLKTVCDVCFNDLSRRRHSNWGSQVSSIKSVGRRKR